MNTCIIEHHLNSKYPYRSSQIEILLALFDTFFTHNQSDNISNKNISNVITNSTYHQHIRIPTVTFLTGAPSTGKTSILLDIVHCFRNQSLQNFGYAYINCAVLGSSNESTSDVNAKDTVCDVLQDALKQIWTSIDNKGYKDKVPQILNPAKLEDNMTDKYNGIESVHDRSDATTHEYNNNPNSNTTDFRKLFSSGAYPLAFGRSILSLTQRTNSPCLLILDRAERMLSITSKPTHNSKLLPQLLLLPKTMGLNLWIIVVTTKSLLAQMRMNNYQGSIQDCIQPINVHFEAYRGKDTFKKILNTAEMKLLTIGYQPPSPNIQMVYDTMLDSLILSVQDATRDLSEIQRLAQLLWPKYMKPLQKRWDQFINEDIPTSEQHDLKRELDEEARPWIQKLIATCLFNPGSNFDQDDLITNTNTSTKQQSTFLKSQWMKQAKIKQRILDSTLLAEIPPFLETLPIIPQFLLIAGFLCQHNQSDTDQNLFTNLAKGRRRKSTSRNCESDQDNILRSFDSNIFKATSSFPLERLLSIFCSIYGQYGDISSQEDDFTMRKSSQNIEVGSLGTVSIFDSIIQLLNLGPLRSMASSSSSWVGREQDIDVFDVSTKYHCTLSKQLAMSISSDVGFPLREYLMHN